MPIVASLLGGGACGALLNEYFRRRRSLTQRIPLIERINRRPVIGELKGIRLFRDVEGALKEVNNVREYQMTLRNSSENDLKSAEIHFEFSGQDLDSWCSRTKVGNIELKKVDTVQARPDQLCSRWKFPQFPAGDSVEFFFQVLEPVNDGYVVALYETNNVVVRKMKDEPDSDWLRYAPYAANPTALLGHIAFDAVAGLLGTAVRGERKSAKDSNRAQNLEG